MLVCEIPNIAMNFRSAGVWGHLPNLDRTNWKRSLRTKWRRTKVQVRFRCKWRMGRRSSIQRTPVQYWALFSIQSTTNLNTSVLMQRSGCWMPIVFANHQVTVFQAKRIQFQACLGPGFWCTRFGPSGSSWGDGCGMLICQEHWWWMKWVLERLSPQWQQHWLASCWLRRLSWGYRCRFCGGIPLQSGWTWYRMTFPALSVNSGSGIHSRCWILCPAACWRGRQHRLMGIQHLYQRINQSWWSQWLKLQRPSRLSSRRWHMEPISNSSTCWTPKMQISPTRIWTLVLICWRTDGISTLWCMIP